MQSRRFIACRGALGLAALLLAGTAFAQDAAMADPATALVDTKIDAQAQDAESAPAWSATETITIRCAASLMIRSNSVLYAASTVSNSTTT